LDKDKFNEIIDFAVAREKEAVKFYQDLQKMVTFKSRQKVLKGYEEIEKTHIVILEDIRKNIKKNIESPLPEIQDLVISNYLVETKPTDDMTYQDILITAMKREEKATQLYTKLASEAADGQVKKLFQKLANEESKHKLYFEKVYDEEVLTEN